MLESISLLYAASPATVLGFVFIFGALIGSFLNVVIYRLPVMMERDWQFQARQILELDTEQSEQPPFNLVTPNSRCPKCQRPIKPWENIPILSYLLLKGQCAGCGTGIS
ncbi:MAG: prepilin peptidase, partial [Pseudomonadales bacterium]